MDTLAGQFTAVVLGVLGYALVLATLGVLGARVRLTQARHDLLVESKRRRLEFELQLAAAKRSEKAAEQAQSDVIIEDDEPAPEPADASPPLAQAA